MISDIVITDDILKRRLINTVSVVLTPVAFQSKYGKCEQYTAWKLHLYIELIIINDGKEENQLDATITVYW